MGPVRGEALARPARTGWGWGLTVCLLLGLLGGALYALGWQLQIGLGITGMNSPAYWGLYIVNFVFFVGLSAGGIIIASLVHALGLSQFRSVARIAELMAISCMILALLFILLDLGRPDRLANLFLHGQLWSPLVWDVIVINLYLIVSLIYGYFGLRGDLARLLAMTPGRRWLYRLLALGYTDLSSRALARDQKVVRIVAFVGLPLAVALHTVTAWILGLVKARPGWYGAIMAPLFIISATVSGLALLLASVVFCRRFLKLPIEEKVVRDLGKLLVLSIPVLGYLLFAELLTVLYGREPGAFHVFEEMMFGGYAPVFWGNLLFGLLFPLAVLGAILFGVNRQLVLGGGVLATPLVAVAAARLPGWTPPVLGGVFTAILEVPVPPWLGYALLWLGGLLLLLLLLDQRMPADVRIGIAAGLVVVGVLAERWMIVVIPLIGHAHLPYAYVPPSYAPTAVEALLAVGVYAVGGLLFAFSAKFLPLVELEPSTPGAHGGES
ncbi:MAG: NrfD/PsrC family molybdoenzyme membrane anchor subunit [Candidatus Methylomirabilia bacterium]